MSAGRVTGVFLGDFRAARLYPSLLSEPEIEFRFHGDTPFPEKAWLTLWHPRPLDVGEFLLGRRLGKCLLWREELPDVEVDFKVHAVGYEGKLAVIDLVAL